MTTGLKGVRSDSNIPHDSREGPFRSPSNLEYCAPTCLWFSLPVSTCVSGKGQEGPMGGAFLLGFKDSDKTGATLGKIVTVGTIIIL